MIIAVKSSFLINSGLANGIKYSKTGSHISAVCVSASVKQFFNKGMSLEFINLDEWEFDFRILMMP